MEDDLRREYASAVFYADDAFAGLHLMESLSSEGRDVTIAEGRKVKEVARAVVWAMVTREPLHAM